MWTGSTSSLRCCGRAALAKLRKRSDLLRVQHLHILTSYWRHVDNFSCPMSFWGLRCWWWEVTFIAGTQLILQFCQEQKATCNLWWTSHLPMMRREAVPGRFKTPWRKQRGHKESWGKHPWEGTKGMWQLREEKQLLNKQKCYQAQTLGELKKGNRNGAPGSVWEPGGSEQKWICADPPQAPRTPSLWAGEKLPVWSSDLCMALLAPQGFLCWNVDCPYLSSWLFH